MYLNIPQACYTPLIHRTAWAQRTDSLSASSKLHMLFVPDAVVKFPIGTLKGFIGFVRVLQDSGCENPSSSFAMNPENNCIHLTD